MALNRNKLQGHIVRAHTHATSHMEQKNSLLRNKKKEKYKKNIERKNGILAHLLGKGVPPTSPSSWISITLAPPVDGRQRFAGPSLEKELLN